MQIDVLLVRVLCFLWNLEYNALTGRFICNMQLSRWCCTLVVIATLVVVVVWLLTVVASCWLGLRTLEYSHVTLKFDVECCA